MLKDLLDLETSIDLDEPYGRCRIIFNCYRPWANRFDIEIVGVFDSQDNPVLWQEISPSLETDLLDRCRDHVRSL